MVGSFTIAVRAGMLRAGLMLLAAIAPRCPAAGAPDLPEEARNRIDAAIAEAYSAASQGLPCKVKGRGRPRIMRWEEVDRCLNDAAARVDWEALSQRLASVRAGIQGVSSAEFEAAVETSLSSQSLPFERVLASKDKKVLLPLTNSLLKFLPPDSLLGLVVSDKVGTQLGEFAGVYAYERVGGLASANTYRLVLFQYSEPGGKVQSAPEKLLLDSYGVSWKDAAAQRGFRLNSDKLSFSARTR